MSDSAKYKPVGGRSHAGQSRRVDGNAEWRSKLTQSVGITLLFETITGLIIYLFPFGVFPQVSLLAHTIIGFAMLAPLIWYLTRHWLVRRHGNLSHYQVLGYVAAALLGICLLSGVIVTWQGVFGPRVSASWDIIHLVAGIAVVVFVLVHLMTVLCRRINNPEARMRLRVARNTFVRGSFVGTVLLLSICVVWSGLYSSPNPLVSFSSSYNWSFGGDRPFAPSLTRLENSDWEADVRRQVHDVVGETLRAPFDNAFNTYRSEPIGLFERVRRSANQIGLDADAQKRIEAILDQAALFMRQQGAIDARQLSGSAGCGTSGCHSEIYDEWLPSAHRYSSMDDLFQQVQSLMAVETSPEHTRYCAGCHDPISLLSGAKNSDNVTLSVLGADEGTSCLVCHSIVQTDVQGNGDYVISPPQRYAYELSEGLLAKFTSDFLIRTYPQHHSRSYARPLYKTAEFCGACHKQYVDTEVNTDIGKVQGQNQYDSWKNSRWYHAGSPELSIECRECHMPLNTGDDPARGDSIDYNRSKHDRMHRSHRMLASNQYIPTIMGLEGADRHVELIQQWLRGEYEIPEIADKWTTGPVVLIQITAPEKVRAGEAVPLRVTLINNKTGHDFPTGPLDMIESWIELTVTDDLGNIVYHIGGLDSEGAVVDSPVIFKADGFDREGQLIDRHNLWDLVGASYKRAMYPGVTDTFETQFQCPSMARGRLMETGSRNPPGQRTDEYTIAAPESAQAKALHVEVNLWYRKANPEFLDRVYGSEAQVRSPATRMTTASTRIEISSDGNETPE